MSTALDRLRAAGVAVRLAGGRLFASPKSCLTDALRRLLRECKAELLAALRPSVNPLLTTVQLGECHAGGWGSAEIATFTERALTLARAGLTDDDAEHLAERLTLRDREGDSRVLCAECLYTRDRKCPGGFPLQRDLLHNCQGFTP